LEVHTVDDEFIKTCGTRNLNGILFHCGFMDSLGLSIEQRGAWGWEAVKVGFSIY